VTVGPVIGEPLQSPHHGGGLLAKQLPTGRALDNEQFDAYFPGPTFRRIHQRGGRLRIGKARQQASIDGGRAQGRLPVGAGHITRGSAWQITPTPHHSHRYVLPQFPVVR
jgi:hypothetical protein